MSLSAIASRGLANSYQRAEESAKGLVEKGPNVDDAVSLREAKKGVEIAAKVLKVDDELHDSIIDIIV